MINPKELPQSPNPVEIISVLEECFFHMQRCADAGTFHGLHFTNEVDAMRAEDLFSRLASLTNQYMGNPDG